MKKRELGYSLVEVLIALAITIYLVIALLYPGKF